MQENQLIRRGQGIKREQGVGGGGRGGGGRSGGGVRSEGVEGEE